MRLGSAMGLATALEWWLQKSTCVALLVLLGKLPWVHRGCPLALATLELTWLLQTEA